jgi:site-specific recombinase XerD
MEGPHRLVDLYDAASYHQLVLQTEGRSPATMRLYLLYEKRFIEFLEARKIPADLHALNAVNARQAVLWFQQHAHGKRGGQQATRMFLNVLKTWAGFLEREGVWEDSPLRKVRRVKTRHYERQPFTRTEVQAMLQAAGQSRMPERDTFLILLLLDTGARISEATGLRLGDVRLDTRSVRVLGKGNRERSIPIGSPQHSDGGPLFRAYRAYLKVRTTLAERSPDRADDRLFLTPSGYPLTATGGTDVIRRLGEAAGVVDATPHRLRHTMATQYLVAHVGDEMGLRRILGHLSHEMLETYVHLSQLELRQRMGQAPLSSSWLKAQ